MSGDLTKFKGGRELAAFLDALPKRLAKGAMRSALRAGANVVSEEARRTAPVHEGKLRASIKVSTNSRKDVATATVRARMFYARFIEFGTAAHDIPAKKGGSLFIAGLFRELAHHPGIKARPFMRPALDAKASEAVRAMGDQLQKRLNKQGLKAGSLEIDEGDKA